MDNKLVLLTKNEIKEHELETEAITKYIEEITKNTSNSKIDIVKKIAHELNEKSYKINRIITKYESINEEENNELQKILESITTDLETKLKSFKNLENLTKNSIPGLDEIILKRMLNILNDKEKEEINNNIQEQLVKLALEKKILGTEIAKAMNKPYASFRHEYKELITNMKKEK